MLQLHNADFISLSIRLNELRSEFDRSMREGGTFEQIKKIYLQIKELTYYLQMLAMEKNA